MFIILESLGSESESLGSFERSERKETKGKDGVGFGVEKDTKRLR